MKRILGNGRSYYHTISRVVDKRMVFGDREKEVFRRILRNQEAFSGVRVLTYCLMSNHFHLLLEVPDREELAPMDEKGLLEVLPLLYDEETVEGVRQELERAREAGDGRWHAEILQRYERRRGNLACFMKELKLRVSLYMNKRLGREGTLWERRYHSVLIEDRAEALLTVGAYIDLNPVRAGMVAKPEDYRWCGYAEAVAGGKRGTQARQGLARMLEESRNGGDSARGWKAVSARYRLLLYEEGRAVTGDPQLGEPGRAGFTDAEVEAVQASGGELSVAEALRQRVRHFTCGAVLGSAEFVDAVCQRESGVRRKGARRLRGADWGDLRVLRDSRKRGADSQSATPCDLREPAPPSL